MSPPTVVSVKVWNEFAAISRPGLELSVERISLPDLMTPSAARGVLDAILYQTSDDAGTSAASPPCGRTFPDGFPADEARTSPTGSSASAATKSRGTIPPRIVEGWMKSTRTTFATLPRRFRRPRRCPGAEPHATQQRSCCNTSLISDRSQSPKLTPKGRTAPGSGKPRKPTTTAAPTPSPSTSPCSNRRVAKGQCFHRPYLGMPRVRLPRSPRPTAPKRPSTDLDRRRSASCCTTFGFRVGPAEPAGLLRRPRDATASYTATPRPPAPPARTARRRPRLV